MTSAIRRGIHNILKKYIEISEYLQSLLEDEVEQETQET